MDKSIISEALIHGYVHNGYIYFCAESERDHRIFYEILRKHVSDGSEWESVCELRSAPKYDQDVFEDMICDFVGDSTNFDGDAAPEVYTDTITYNEINDRWSVYCKFADDDHLYTIVGYDDGVTELYY